MARSLLSMLPLSFFLLIWLIVMSVFVLLALLTVVMALRYGLSGFTTYIVTAGFLIVIALGFVASGSYFSTVDWTQTVTVFSTALPTL